MSDWLTPDELGDNCCIFLPWRQGLFPHLIGALQQMTYKRNWETEGAATIEEITQFVKGALATMEIDNACDFEVRVDAATGKVQYRRGTGAWQNAQRSDGGDYTVVLDNDTIINNLYKLPPAASGDKYCTAAYALAATWGDDSQDTMEIIDALETVTAEAFENFLDSLVGWIPVISTVVGVVEFVHEGIAQPAIDFVRENCTDIDAVNLAAHNIYCAFRACIDNSDSLNNWHSYIDYPGILDGTATFINATGIPTWSTFKEMVEAIYGTLDGSYAGWFVVAWGGFVTFASNQLAGGLTVIEKAIGYGATTGLQRNETDCGNCGDCSIYEQTDLRWEITLGSHISSGCDGSGEGVSNGGSGEIEIWLTLPQVRAIQSIAFFSHNGSGATHSLAQVYEDTTLIATILDFSGQGGAVCNHNAFNVGGAAGNRIRFYESCAVSTEWTNLQVCWS